MAKQNEVSPEFVTGPPFLYSITLKLAFYPLASIRIIFYRDFISVVAVKKEQRMATDIDAVKTLAVPQPEPSLPAVVLDTPSGPLLLEMMRLAPTLWQIFADALTENVEGKRWNTLLLQPSQGTASTLLPTVEAPKKRRAKTLGAKGPDRKSASRRGKNPPRPKLRKRRNPRVKQHRARIGAVSTPAGGFWETTGEQIGDFSDSPDNTADAVRSMIVEESANGPRRFNAC